MSEFFQPIKPNELIQICIFTQYEQKEFKAQTSTFPPNELMKPGELQRKTEVHCNTSETNQSRQTLMCVSVFISQT